MLGKKRSRGGKQALDKLRKASSPVFAHEGFVFLTALLLIICVFYVGGFFLGSVVGRGDGREQGKRKTGRGR